MQIIVGLVESFGGIVNPTPESGLMIVVPFVLAWVIPNKMPMIAQAMTRRTDPPK